MLRLLKNAESNADAKNIDLEDLIIKNIVVQQAPVCLRPTVFLAWAHSFIVSRKRVAARTVPMVASTLTRATRHM
jgi:hypothetical protein